MKPKELFERGSSAAAAAAGDVVERAVSDLGSSNAGVDQLVTMFPCASPSSIGLDVQSKIACDPSSLTGLGVLIASDSAMATSPSSLTEEAIETASWSSSGALITRTESSSPGFGLPVFIAPFPTGFRLLEEEFVPCRDTRRGIELPFNRSSMLVEREPSLGLCGSGGAWGESIFSSRSELSISMGLFCPTSSDADGNLGEDDVDVETLSAFFLVKIPKGAVQVMRFGFGGPGSGCPGGGSGCPRPNVFVLVGAEVTGDPPRPAPIDSLDNCFLGTTEAGPTPTDSLDDCFFSELDQSVDDGGVAGLSVSASPPDCTD
jgi:hypothetical protein